MCYLPRPRLLSDKAHTVREVKLYLHVRQDGSGGAQWQIRVGYAGWRYTKARHCGQEGDIGVKWTGCSGNTELHLSPDTALYHTWMAEHYCHSALKWELGQSESLAVEDVQWAIRSMISPLRSKIGPSDLIRALSVSMYVGSFRLEDGPWCWASNPTFFVLFLMLFCRWIWALSNNMGPIRGVFRYWCGTPCTPWDFRQSFLSEERPWAQIAPKKLDSVQCSNRGLYWRDAGGSGYQLKGARCWKRPRTGHKVGHSTTQVDYCTHITFPQLSKDRSPTLSLHKNFAWLQQAKVNCPRRDPCWGRSPVT